jgi:tRNA A-37 threonylcarbamoyl transferase component Bud32
MKMRNLIHTKLVFSVTLDQPISDQRLVKFTQQCSKYVHNFLASRGSAPRLRQCVQVSDEWTAVVMDRSKYEVLYGLSLSKANQEEVLGKVKEVQMLHNEGFVHGDIRDTNLLVNLDSFTSDDVK